MYAAWLQVSLLLSFTRVLYLQSDENPLTFVGDEWSDRSSLEQVSVAHCASTALPNDSKGVIFVMPQVLPGLASSCERIMFVPPLPSAGN